MFKFVLATIMLMAVSAASSGVMPPALGSGEVSFMQFMLRSNALAQENPTRSLTCFDYYMPLLNGITAEYQRAYGSCLAKAEAQKEDVDAATKPERALIEDTTQDACQVLTDCVAIKSSIPYFECFVNGGGEATKVFYGVQQNSSTILDRVREDFRLIENAENRCTTVAERAYVKDTADTYEELQNCLAGKTPVPTTTTTTTPQPTTTIKTTPQLTTTTTPAPIITTGAEYAPESS